MSQHAVGIVAYSDDSDLDYEKYDMVVTGVQPEHKVPEQNEDENDEPELQLLMLLFSSTVHSSLGKKFQHNRSSCRWEQFSRVESSIIFL